VTLFDVANWALYRYKLPLHKPIAARGANRLVRKGLLIFIRNEWGIGIGEAAPIEDFHPVSFEQTQEDILSALRNTKPPEHFIARCAIEMAQHRCASKEAVPVNGLLTNSSVIDPQFSCYKIKVGRQTVQSDAVMVRTIINTLPPQTKIRLDANCAWSLSECMVFWKSLKEHSQHIEYIEEPLSNPNDYRQLSIPFALDERLLMFADQLHTLHHLRAIILKPSLLGFQACKDWFTRAKQLKLHAVISSTFESSIGLFAYADIAQPDTHCGLGTNSWFKEDLLEKRAIPTEGMLFIPQSNRLLHHPSLTCIDAG